MISIFAEAYNTHLLRDLAFFDMIGGLLLATYFMFKIAMIFVDINLRKIFLEEDKDTIDLSKTNLKFVAIYFVQLLMSALLGFVVGVITMGIHWLILRNASSKELKSLHRSQNSS